MSVLGRIDRTVLMFHQGAMLYKPNVKALSRMKSALYLLGSDNDELSGVGSSAHDSSEDSIRY